MGIKPTVFFFLFLLSSANLLADIRVLKNSYNARTDDKNFFSSSNILGQVPAGSEVDVLSERKLGSGALSIKILLKKLPKKYRGELEAGDIVYIYQKNNTTAFSDSKKKAKQKLEAGLSCSGFECQNSSATVLGYQQGVSTSRKLLAALEEGAEKAHDAAVDTAAKAYDFIEKYEKSPKVAKAVKWAKDNVKRLFGSGKCYKVTKSILKSGDLIPYKFSDKYARDGVDTLTEYGLVNLLAKPYSFKFTTDTAPKGAVLVYESAVACNKSTKNIMGQGCGHIEVKLGDGSDTKGFKYASDYKSGKSILDGSTGHKYRLVGVMIKPDL